MIIIPDVELQGLENSTTRVNGPDYFGIFWNGHRVTLYSGKSVWGTAAGARGALTAHIASYYFYHKPNYVRAAVQNTPPTDWSHDVREYQNRARNPKLVREELERRGVVVIRRIGDQP